MEEEKNHIKKMKGLSKALSIISKILKVCSIIAGCFAIFAMIIIPFLFKKISITDNEIKINNDIVFQMTQKEDKMQVSLFGKSILFDATNEEIESITKLFNEKSKNSLLIYLEATMCVSVATLVVLYMVLHYIDKLFTNIVNEKSPFTMDNIIYIRRCGYYLIALIAIPLILSGVFEVITDIELVFNFNMIYVLLVLVIFAMSYVFEYGYNIENKNVKKETTIKE